MILDKRTKNKIFVEFSGDYNGVSLKNFQRIEPKLENAFLAFWEFRNFKKINNGIWFLQ